MPATSGHWRALVVPEAFGRRGQRLLVAAAALLLFLLTSSGFALQVTLAGLLAVAGLAVWKWPRVAVFALVILAPIHPFLMMLVLRASGSAGVVKAAQLWKEFLVVVLLAKAVDLAFRRRRGPSVSLFDVTLVAFLAYALLYVVYPSEVPGSTLFTKLSGLRADTLFLLAYFIGRGIPLSARQVRLLLSAFMVVAFVIGCVAIIQFAAPSAANGFFNGLGFSQYIGLQRGDAAVTNAVRDNSVNGTLIPRASSLVLSDLALAFYTLLAAPLAAGLLINLRSIRAKVTSNALMLLLTATTVLTVTRSAILAIVPALAALFVRSGAVLTAIVLAMEGAVLALPLIVRLKLTPTLLAQIFSPNEASAAGHLTRLRESVQILQAEPLGRGLGTAGEVAQRFTPVGGITNESWYFQIATEMGLVAGVMFGLVLIGLLVLMLVRYRQARDPWLKALCLGMAGATIGFAGVGITLHVWDGLATSMVFWLLAGIAAQAPAIEAGEAGA